MSFIVTQNPGLPHCTASDASQDVQRAHRRTEICTMLDTMEYLLSHGQKYALKMKDTSQDSQAMAMCAEEMW